MEIHKSKLVRGLPLVTFHLCQGISVPGHECIRVDDEIEWSKSKWDQLHADCSWSIKGALVLVHLRVGGMGWSFFLCGE